MSFWEEYKEMKLELVKEFIKSVKRQKLAKIIIANYELSKLIKIAFDNLNQKKIKRKKALRSVFMAVRFYAYNKYRYGRPFGQSIDLRSRNI